MPIMNEEKMVNRVPIRWAALGDLRARACLYEGLVPAFDPVDTPRAQIGQIERGDIGDILALGDHHNGPVVQWPKRGKPWPDRPDCARDMLAPERHATPQIHKQRTCMHCRKSGSRVKAPGH